MLADVILPPSELAYKIAGVASDKQADDVVVIDIRGLSDFSDYFVVLSVDSNRQLGALTTDIEKALECIGVLKRNKEGHAQDGWVLLDFGDVVVHLLCSEEREFYDLDGLWSDGVELVRIQ